MGEWVNKVHGPLHPQEKSSATHSYTKDFCERNAPELPYLEEKNSKIAIFNYCSTLAISTHVR
jgi:hypothetical protein